MHISARRDWSWNDDLVGHFVYRGNLDTFNEFAFETSLVVVTFNDKKEWGLNSQRRNILGRVSWVKA